MWGPAFGGGDGTGTIELVIDLNDNAHLLLRRGAAAPFVRVGGGAPAETVRALDGGAGRLARTLNRLGVSGASDVPATESDVTLGRGGGAGVARIGGFGGTPVAPLLVGLGGGGGALPGVAGGGGTALDGEDVTVLLRGGIAGT